MNTTEQWEALYKKEFTTKGFTQFYKTANQEAESIGYLYMTGQVSISELTTWLNTTGSTWPFRRSESIHFLNKGVVRAVKGGTALVSKVQPEQEEALAKELARLKEEKPQARKSRKAHKQV